MLKLVEVGEPLVLWSQEGRKPVELSMTDVYRAFGSDSTNLIQAIIYYYNGREEKTQSSAMRVLIDFGRLSQGLCNLTLPITSKEWQEFIINLYDKWLNRTHLSLKSRVDTWNFLRFSLERLRDAEDIIPLDVEFPRPSIRTALDEADEYKQRLLGDPKFKPFETQVHQKVLMAISLSRSDAEYLDIVRDTLSLRRATLERACQEWWRMMREHFEFGQRLINSVDWPSYAAKLDDPAYWRERVGAAHRANGKTEESLAILLSLFAHVYDRTCTKAEFGSIAAIPHLSTAELPESAPTVIDGIGKLRRLNWMLGNFYTEDYAYIHLLLVMQHPVLSGSAFTDAKVSDRSGSPFVTIGPRFKPIRKYISDNTDTPGHTPLIPLPLSLGYAQAALELIVNSGEELVRFYLAGTRYCQENKLFSIKSSDSDKKETLQKRNCWVIDNVPQSLQALGLSCWGSVFAASGKSPYTKLRTAPGVHDIIDVLLGAIVYLIVSVCPLRAAEIISLTVGDLYLLDKDGYWLARDQHKRNVNDFLMDKARPIPNVVASAFSMAKQLSDGLRELMNLKTHDDGRVLFFVPAANRSAHLSARRITRSRLESCLERFCDYCGFPVDPLGRRWYVRPHEIRKSFLINFFYCTGFGGLDATRWMAGHADLSTIFAYLKTNLPREHLVEVEAALAYEELWNVENGGGEQTSNAASLYSDVCRRFGVRKISAVKKNDLERFILEAFKGDLYEVEIVSDLGSSAESVAFVIRSQNGRQRR